MDTIASEYGWTFEQIVALSSRQVSFLLAKISDRRQINLALDASLHGIKLPMPGQADKVDVEFTEEDDKAAEIAIQRMLERKLKEKTR